jgi:hypothetical protein
MGHGGAHLQCVRNERGIQQLLAELLDWNTSTQHDRAESNDTPRATHWSISNRCRTQCERAPHATATRARCDDIAQWARFENRPNEFFRPKARRIAVAVACP